MRDAAVERVRALDASFLPLPRFQALADLCLGAVFAACGPSVRGAMVHGSCLPAELGGKGGFIPGFSDFDFHVYLEPNRMRTTVECSLDTALALQERFSAVQAAAAGTAPVQLFCVSTARLPPSWSLPEGAYHLLHGAMPPSAEGELPPRTRARARLRGCRLDGHAVTRSLCDKSDAGLRGTVRTCASMFKGVLPHAAVLAGADGDAVWLWPLSRLVLEAAPEAGVGAEALGFWGELGDWQAARESPTRLRAMVAAAVRGLDHLADWAEVEEQQ